MDGAVSKGVEYLKYISINASYKTYVLKEDSLIIRYEACLVVATLGLIIKKEAGI